MNTSAQGVPEDLVNKDLVRAWLWWSLVWLTIFPLVGLLVSIKFHNPDFLGESSWLTFGRLRPVHVNGVIFGAFSTPVIGLLYYLVPRLCGRRMAKEAWGWWQLVGWNIFLIAGSISLMEGANLGVEAGEYPLPINILRWVLLAIIGGQVLVTIFRRKEPAFYVALWYALAALVWTVMNLILGGVVLPYVPMSGISNTALHGLYIHYVVGLWITPAGLALMYYFLPLAAKNPLFSHRLSLLGFWSLALFYPFVGTHHYIFSPIPYHNQTISIVTSMLLIIPVWAVITNLFGTAFGRWGAILNGRDGDSYSAKFLLLATFFYLVGCFQGSTEALRRMQELTHFTDYVISHSHFTVFATFVLAAVGSIYYVWPRVTGRELWSWKLASWHLWLTIVGTTIMLGGLAAQGLIQGSNLENGAEWVDTVVEMKPWWVMRTLAGATMDVGFVLMMVNMIMTARAGVSFRVPAINARVSETRPAIEEVSWFNRPSGVFITAGIGFFFAAVIIQGIVPSILPETYVPAVISANTGQLIKVADYTPLERRGRQVYIREGCWYCHSQFVRPVTGEDLRWGPVSQAGEYVFDQPHMLSTRRIGPDLIRVGGKYGDDWHTAHHWNPRDVVPDSIMPRFPWLFDDNGNGIPTLNTDGVALVAYLQRLGTSIGDWRETFGSTRLSSDTALQEVSEQKSRDLLPLGKEVYFRRCVGCHGEHGDGKGVAARFLYPKPRDFTSGIFKFRSTSGGANTLPSDEDLLITVTHGLWGTAMPPWYGLQLQERLAVIQYIKTFSDRWTKEKPGPPVAIPKEPPVTAASIANGKKLFEEICAACHGAGGQGDGMLAGSLTDVWGNSIVPANFTLSAGASGGVTLGHDGHHIFKTIMTGVGGTPMPAFADTFKPAQVWDIVHFEQSLHVNAEIAALKQASFTGPPQADFCTSSVPWLRAACNNVILPVIAFCTTHDQQLRARLAANQLTEAREQIWAALSEAAERHQIDPQIVNIDQPPPRATVAAITPTAGKASP